MLQRRPADLPQLARARFSTQMFLTKNPNATDGTSLDKIPLGSINEHNGFNRTSTCITRRVAVFEIKEPIGDAVYVSLLGPTEPIYAPSPFSASPLGLPRP